MTWFETQTCDQRILAGPVHQWRTSALGHESIYDGADARARSESGHISLNGGQDRV
jgi:hypothetical protein